MLRLARHLALAPAYVVGFGLGTTLALVDDALGLLRRHR